MAIHAVAVSQNSRWGLGGIWLPQRTGRGCGKYAAMALRMPGSGKQPIGKQYNRYESLQWMRTMATILIWKPLSSIIHDPVIRPTRPETQQVMWNVIAKHVNKSPFSISVRCGKYNAMTGSKHEHMLCPYGENTALYFVALSETGRKLGVCMTHARLKSPRPDAAQFGWIINACALPKNDKSML